MQRLCYVGNRNPRSSIPDFGGKAADEDQAHLHGHVCGGLSVLLILWSSQAGEVQPLHHLSCPPHQRLTQCDLQTTHQTVARALKR